MITLQPIGNWEQQVHQSLRNALYLSTNVMGRTGEEACKHALILMARSARAMAKKSRKRRPIMRDTRLHGAQYVDTYRQGDSRPHRLYKLQFGTIAQRRPGAVKGTWERAQKIRNSGLAKRSWMWGLASLGATVDSAPIPGTSKVYSLRGDKVCGYIKENRLGYILKTMPAGWESTLESSVAKQIMAQAARKMEGQWRRDMNAQSRAIERPLKSFFKSIAA